jgi:hypothetical protein
MVTTRLIGFPLCKSTETWAACTVKAAEQATRSRSMTEDRAMMIGAALSYKRAATMKTYFYYN